MDGGCGRRGCCGSGGCCGCGRPHVLLDIPQERVYARTIGGMPRPGTKATVMTTVFPRRPTSRGAGSFTDEDIRSMRRMAADGMSAVDVRRFYPTVGVETIRRILRRETYAHVMDHSLRPLPNADQDESIQAMLRMAKEAEAQRRRNAEAMLDELGEGPPPSPLDEQVGGEVKGQ